MELGNNPLQPLWDLLPPGELRDFLSGPGGWVVLGALALVLLLILLAVLGKLGRMLFGRRPGPIPDQDRALMEELATYPLPPPVGVRQLTVEGVPVRLRLVVVAPLGKGHVIDPEVVEALLDQVTRGLGDVIDADQPHLRIWPVQLSSQGFAHKFHRLVHRPEPDGQPSHWILVAGQTPPRPRPLLVGLALWAREANHIGRLTLEPVRWNDQLRIVKSIDY
jgi:hypothetical protein